ncbi:hypothetical protein CTAYLR_009758 [Chrysophaeum taylorii]|uniref:Mg-protoporphyrin IX chelatase n=1 Tax=Chrysophaeum taylorii TaxID=2483200 RepID=A0AAD7UAJ8_9STRA|nr:hypothetical protein CTAYLR_009758 [Chrysophaeum taylorii]
MRVLCLMLGGVGAFVGTPPMRGTPTAMRAAVADAEARAEMAAALDESSPTRAAASSAFNSQGVLPLSKVVGQESIKKALLLAAVNRDMGGVLISGGRGTAKSVMARGLHALLPPIERVVGSYYNLDAADVEGTVETEVVPAPFVQIPLNVMDDMLVGSIDVERSVETGESLFQPGLLARAHRGILYVDDLNLLDSEATNILLQVLSDGRVLVEREGISVSYPCKPLLVATFNPEEGEIRDHVLDRIAVTLSADAAPLSVEERVEAVDGVLAFSSSSTSEEAEETEDAMRTRIVFAREDIKDIRLKKEQLLYLCEEAIRAGCQGHRAELFAAEVARASAALESRSEVASDDLKLAARLAILPRSSFVNDPDREADMTPPPPPPPPPPPQQQLDEDQEEEEQDQEQPPEEQREEDDEPPPDEAPDELPEEFMFDAEGVPIDPELLAFATKQKTGKSGGRGLIFSEDRGRYIKAQLPRGRARRLAVDATLRAAAPYQKARRERYKKDPKFKGRSVFVEEGDVRTKRMARKAGSLIIFVVDASGSMALNRMQAAKGAALSLLTQAYQSRDQISLIPFQGDKAEVLVPPTRSIALTKRRLETMACGGASPLAHALSTAARTGLNAQKSGDVGKVVVVCIGDGRANVPLSVSLGTEPPQDKPDRAKLKQELLDTAKQLGVLPGFSLLMLDTESKFISTGLAKEIADAAAGRYFKLPKTTDAAIADLTAGAISQLK